MRAARQPHKHSPRNVRLIVSRPYTANPAVQEVGPHFENPTTLEAKDYLHHPYCTYFVLVLFFFCRVRTNVRPTIKPCIRKTAAGACISAGCSTGTVPVVCRRIPVKKIPLTLLICVGFTAEFLRCFQ